MTRSSRLSAPAALRNPDPISLDASCRFWMQIRPFGRKIDNLIQQFKIVSDADAAHLFHVKRSAYGGDEVPTAGIWP